MGHFATLAHWFRRCAGLGKAQAVTTSARNTRSGLATPRQRPEAVVVSILREAQELSVS